MPREERKTERKNGRKNATKCEPRLSNCCLERATTIDDRLITVSRAKTEKGNKDGEKAGRYADKRQHFPQV
jgi:hypothetical protein